MSIRMLGTDHTLAPVDVREIFSFTRRAAAEAMGVLKQALHADGCIILSTCNRMEIWVSIDDDENGSADLLEELCRLKHVQPSEYASNFVQREGEEAVKHLFYLTCGLRSMILAEDQILTQVGDALALAREAYHTDSVLEVLFRKAVTAAKRVKTNVVFAREGESSVDRAMEALERQGFSLKGKTCMVIGNGAMGKLAAQALMRRGAEVTVTIRQYKRGIVDTPRGCRRIDYGKRGELLPYCDLVISATASPNCTIPLAMMQALSLSVPMILIDLAVPRDIDPEVGTLPNVTLYDIDDFRSTEDHRNDAAYAQAEGYLNAEMDEFYDWLNGRNIIPRIQTIQQDAAEDVWLRLHKIVRKLPLKEAEQKMLEQSIRAASAKVTGKMMYGLKDTLEEQQFLDCVNGLERLYESKS